MKSLVAKWRNEATELERQAILLDYERNADSTYYSSMTSQQRQKFDRLLDASSELRRERNILNRLAAELEAVIVSAALHPFVPTSDSE
jgi:hypothetical protein